MTVFKNPFIMRTRRSPLVNASMTTMRVAFLAALARLSDRGELGNRPAWIHDLSRRLAGGPVNGG